MEVIFLDGLTLAIKDVAYCDNQYEITLDTVIPQKSKFVVNKINVNCEVGDLIYLKGLPFLYIGVINALETTDEETTELQTKDFLSKFDLKVPVESFGTSNLGDKLLKLIKDNFYSTSDPHKKLSYLLFRNDSGVQGSQKFDDDTLVSIIDLNESWSKEYGARLDYELVLTSGQITNIRVLMKDVTKGIKLRHNLGAISSLIVNDSNEEELNEIIYVPKKDNSIYKDRISFCLLPDKTITNNPLDERRPPKAVYEFQTYSDSDYDGLLDKAKSELLNSSLEHSISFNITTENNTIAPIRDFWIGDYINFVNKTKTYDTIVTRITFKETLEFAKVVLGEFRVNLTDKLKLLERRKT